MGGKKQEKKAEDKKINKRLSESVKEKRLELKFESGIIYHSSKEKSMGKRGNIRNGIPLRKHS